MKIVMDNKYDNFLSHVLLHFFNPAFENNLKIFLPPTNFVWIKIKF
jgi:hypothetical protein